MPDETRAIEPALTPEEWAGERAMLEEYMGRDTAVSLVRSPEVTYFVLHAHDGWRGERNTAAVLATPHHATRIAALANAALPDDDPRKITHDDVVSLYEIALLLERPEIRDALYSQLNDYGVTEIERKLAAARPIGEKLESLLPPDVTTYTQREPAT